MSPPTWWYRHDWYETHARNILSGSLKPDGVGQIALPGSITGAYGFRVDTAFVGTSSDGSVAIYFPDWRGRMNNTGGLVYAPGAAVGSKVSVPGFPALNVSRRVVRGIAVEIEEIIDSNWRRAGYRWD